MRRREQQVLAFLGMADIADFEHDGGHRGLFEHTERRLAYATQPHPGVGPA